MKYLVFEATHGEGSAAIVHEIPIIFPDSLTHKVMAVRIEGHVKQAYGGDKCQVKIIAAGSITVMGQCFDKSDTLGVSSRGEEDSSLINTFDYFHGIVDRSPPEPDTKN